MKVAANTAVKGTKKQGILVGISAIIFDDFKPKNILLIRREKNPFLGKWTFPGGMLNLGETVSDGIKREVYEETGFKVQVPDQKFMNVEQFINSSQKKHWIILTGYCVVDKQISYEENRSEQDKLIKPKFFPISGMSSDPLPDITEEQCIPNLKSIVQRFLKVI